MRALAGSVGVFFLALPALIACALYEAWDAARNHFLDARTCSRTAKIYREVERRVRLRVVTTYRPLPPDQE